jgi:hypothetical protein
MQLFAQYQLSSNRFKLHPAPTLRSPISINPTAFCGHNTRMHQNTPLGASALQTRSSSLSHATSGMIVSIFISAERARSRRSPHNCRRGTDNPPGMSKTDAANFPKFKPGALMRCSRSRGSICIRRHPVCAATRRALSDRPAMRNSGISAGGKPGRSCREATS